jgi:hypothetical protein
MMKNETWCIKLSDSKICPSCNSNSVVKNSFTANEKQQFFVNSVKIYL